MAFTETFLAANLDKFPADQMPLLKQKLNEIDEDQNDFVYSTNLKNPQTALILSIFLGGFGVDRFYIGDTMLGILKLFFSWITFGLWTIIDMFLIQKACRKNNLENIQRIIAATNKKSKKSKINENFDSHTGQTPVIDVTEVEEVEIETLD